MSRPMDAASGLGAILRDAARGRFPDADGGIDTVAPYRPGLEAMVGFTGHAVAVTELPRDRLLAAGADGFAGATSLPVMMCLAGPDGELDVLDVLLLGVGTGSGGPPVRDDLEGHERVMYARRHRDRVRVHGDARGLLTLGLGLGGLFEVSFAVEPDRRGRGHGRSLLLDGLGLVPAGEPVLAAVAPGNAASLRAVLAAGFGPIGSVQLVHPGPAR
jgi:GNAT superfamily N-acetyltransferase